MSNNLPRNTSEQSFDDKDKTIHNEVNSSHSNSSYSSSLNSDSIHDRTEETKQNQINEYYDSDRLSDEIYDRRLSGSHKASVRISTDEDDLVPITVDSDGIYEVNLSTEYSPKDVSTTNDENPNFRDIKPCLTPGYQRPSIPRNKFIRFNPVKVTDYSEDEPPNIVKTGETRIIHQDALNDEESKRLSEEEGMTKLNSSVLSRFDEDDQQEKALKDRRQRLITFKKIMMMDPSEQQAYLYALGPDVYEEFNEYVHSENQNNNYSSISESIETEENYSIDMNLDGLPHPLVSSDIHRDIIYNNTTTSDKSDYISDSSLSQITQQISEELHSEIPSEIPEELNLDNSLEQDSIMNSEVNINEISYNNMKNNNDGSFTAFDNFSNYDYNNDSFFNQQESYNSHGETSLHNIEDLSNPNSYYTDDSINNNYYSQGIDVSPIEDRYNNQNPTLYTNSNSLLSLQVNTNLNPIDNSIPIPPELNNSSFMADEKIYPVSNENMNYEDQGFVQTDTGEMIYVPDTGDYYEEIVIPMEPSQELASLPQTKFMKEYINISKKKTEPTSSMNINEVENTSVFKSLKSFYYDQDIKKVSMTDDSFEILPYEELYNQEDLNRLKESLRDFNNAMNSAGWVSFSSKDLPILFKQCNESNASFIHDMIMNIEYIISPICMHRYFSLNPDLPHDLFDIKDEHIEKQMEVDLIKEISFIFFDPTCTKKPDEGLIHFLCIHFMTISYIQSLYYYYHRIRNTLPIRLSIIPNSFITVNNSLNGSFNMITSPSSKSTSTSSALKNNTKNELIDISNFTSIKPTEDQKNHIPQITFNDSLNESIDVTTASPLEDCHELDTFKEDEEEEDSILDDELLSKKEQDINTNISSNRRTNISILDTSTTSNTSTSESVSISDDDSDDDLLKGTSEHTPKDRNTRNIIDLDEDEDEDNENTSGNPIDDENMFTGIAVNNRLSSVRGNHSNTNKRHSRLSLLGPNNEVVSTFNVNMEGARRQSVLTGRMSMGCGGSVPVGVPRSSLAPTDMAQERDKSTINKDADEVLLEDKTNEIISDVHVITNTGNSIDKIKQAVLIGQLQNIQIGSSISSAVLASSQHTAETVREQETINNVYYVATCMSITYATFCHQVDMIKSQIEFDRDKIKNYKKRLNIIPSTEKVSDEENNKVDTLAKHLSSIFGLNVLYVGDSCRSFSYLQFDKTITFFKILFQGESLPTSTRVTLSILHGTDLSPKLIELLKAFSLPAEYKAQLSLEEAMAIIRKYIYVYETVRKNYLVALKGVEE
ncbi:hypothetical protein WA158_002120 [Blastocystis sp. Blastoise]